MLVLASDHAGFPLKEEIKAYLDEKGIEYIDCGTRKIKVYPDTPDNTIKNIENTDMAISNSFKTDNAFIFVCTKVGTQ